MAGLFFVCGLLLPLVAAGTASGQGATLRIDDQTPAPGQQVTITGSGFSASSGAVSLRMDSRTGALLPGGSATATIQGLISVNTTIPAGTSPGWHLIVGTQVVEGNGRQAAFTPGRVRINVGGTGAGGRAAPPPPPGGSGLPGSPLGLLALAAALTLLATGATLTARRIRMHNRPQLGK
jgi:hypothetical protein